MQRWATHLFIVCYLGALGFGLASHALTFLKTCHPAMYFLVWDMFCGWSAYETRIHVVGEGDSGAVYELTPAPWGSFVPYGSAQRHDYDTHGQFGFRLAANVLAHADHEPIRRITVVEECWPKKFNLPAELWEVKYQTVKPESPRSYFSMRRLYNGEGTCLTHHQDWLTTQYEMCVLDNPRLRTDMRKGHTFFATNPGDRSSSGLQPVNFQTEAP